MCTDINHTWYEVKPCVYCKECNVRLYQGTVPEDKTDMIEFFKAIEVRFQALEEE